MVRGGRRGRGRSSGDTSSGRSRPYTTRRSGRPRSVPIPTPAQPFLPPATPVSSGTVSTVAHPALPGRRVADFSLEELVGVIRAVVREDRGQVVPAIGSEPVPMAAGSSAPVISAPRVAPLSVSWSVPLVSSTLPPPVPALVAPPLTLPGPLPGEGTGMVYTS